MARPNYTITADDFQHATAYLGHCLRTFRFDLKDLAMMEQAKEEFHAIPRMRTGRPAAERLQTWCDTYLTESEWKLAKASIRKRRQRWAPSKTLRTITISEKAHRLLSELANRDQVTLSDVLEAYLPAILNRPPKTRNARWSK